MVSLTLQSLSDLCGIRIAYLMWTRRNVTKKCLTQVLFDELVDVVLDDVKNLPLPEQLKSRIFKHVNPTGKHLLSLISLWLSNDPFENSQKWLTSDILFECLILNADGLINQRKTADKILSKRKQNNKLAFRFACINFLEERVLNLWTHVRGYFLYNKIMLEGEQANAFIAQNGFKSDLGTYVGLSDYYSYYAREYPILDNFSVTEPFPFTTESDEVLFWIAFCLSEENATSIDELPHYLGDDVGWCDFSLEFAAFSCNVAFFDYLKNSHNIEYNYIYIIEKIFSSKEEDRKQPCFVFHFSLLNSEEKAELFQEYGEQTLTQLLQWPLSLTFVERPERLWNLMPEMEKVLVFREIYDVLFYENRVLHSILHGDRLVSNLDDLPIISGIYSLDHLAELIVSLWEISSDDNKSFFLDLDIFQTIEDWKGQDVFRTNFVTSGLKDKLYQLFLSNGQAVLDLFEKTNMKESLRSLVAKHMPQHFEELDSRCISSLETHAVLPEVIRAKLKKARKRILFTNERKARRRNFAYPTHEKFLNYVRISSRVEII